MVTPDDRKLLLEPALKKPESGRPAALRQCVRTGSPPPLIISVAPSQDILSIIQRYIRSTKIYHILYQDTQLLGLSSRSSVASPSQDILCIIQRCIISLHEHLYLISGHTAARPLLSNLFAQALLLLPIFRPPLLLRIYYTSNKDISYISPGHTAAQALLSDVFAQALLLLKIIRSPFTGWCPL